MITLSVLDQSPIGMGETATQALTSTLRVAQETERLGYHRFWVSEHHDAKQLAGSSPEILISHLAAHTQRIRLGSGGVMLPHYSAYKVAENFQLLEALYPGRIDVGLGRAPGGMPIATRALQEGKLRNVDLYPQQLDDLIGYLHNTHDETHRFPGLKVSPATEHPPNLWLLGSSGESAGLAASRGAGFAFAQFINGEGGVEAVRSYLQRFQPSLLNEQPRALFAVWVICAETDEEAEQLAAPLDLRLLYLAQGRFHEPTLTVEEAVQYPYSTMEKYYVQENRKRMVIGSKERIKQQLERLCEEYGTQEVMAVTVMNRFEDKLKSFQLLAQAFPQAPAAG
jgi:luciferase family oxidoreductase group 1